MTNPKIAPWQAVFRTIDESGYSSGCAVEHSYRHTDGPGVRKMSLIKNEVERLFRLLHAKRGGLCHNPITGAPFVWGVDPVEPQKRDAVLALLAREWFAVNGPSDAPPLPLSHDEIEDARNASLTGVGGFYARSLALRQWDLREHPSSMDFACGLMAMNTGLWGIEKDACLKGRFPPRSLAGMTPSAHWEPPPRPAA